MFKFNKIVCGGGVREYNYDLLRIVCTIAVITIHVSAIYHDSLTDAGVYAVSICHKISHQDCHDLSSKIA